MRFDPSRRTLLKTGLGAACCAAAHPLLTPVALASAPGEARLVVIVLRGAMDGLAVLPPLADPDWPALRPDAPEAVALGDGRFGLAAALDPLRPLFESGEMGAAHAVSTPYGDGRSHFEGQDMLEAGIGWNAPPELRRQGWLNRLVQLIPDAAPRTAFAVGREDLSILSGTAEVAEWAPDTALSVSEPTQLLLESIYRGDPLLSGAMAEAAELAGVLGGAGGGARVRPGVALARFAAARLSEESRIAAFSLGGWDTHRRQSYHLGRRLSELSDTILALREGLGPSWARTAVFAVTEFGRTARMNGSGGTDHGTGGAMLTAGGALRGGRVLADWPGLSEADLHERRDLRPTRDLRAHVGWAIHSLFGTARSDIERTVFPGLDMGDRSGLI